MSGFIARVSFGEFLHSQERFENSLGSHKRRIKWISISVISTFTSSFLWQNVCLFSSVVILGGLLWKSASVSSSYVGFFSSFPISSQDTNRNRWVSVLWRETCRKISWARGKNLSQNVLDTDNYYFLLDQTFSFLQPAVAFNLSKTASCFREFFSLRKKYLTKSDDPLLVAFYFFIWMSWSLNIPFSLSWFYIKHPGIMITCNAIQSNCSTWALSFLHRSRWKGVFWIFYLLGWGHCSLYGAIVGILLRAVGILYQRERERWCIKTLLSTFRVS